MKRILKTLILLLLLIAIKPLLQAQTTDSFTFTTNQIVPDGNFSGLSDVRNISSGIGSITSLKVRLKIAGEFNGDLYGYIQHSSGYTVLLNRPGKTAANPVGYSDSGFDITFQSDAANGDVHAYQNVTIPADGSPLTGIWQPDGRTLDPSIVTDASARSTSLTNFNGLNAAGSWTLYLADVESGGTNMLVEWGLDIAGTTTPSIVWANPADIVYGTALSSTQLNAVARYNSTNVAGTFTYSTVAGTILNAGDGQTLSVTFTPADTTTFFPVTTNVTINVVKAPLIITAINTNKVYGAPLPGFTASYSGFVNGDTTNNLTSLAAVTTSATDSSSAGDYTISANGATGSNYTFSYVDGTLTVGQALTTSLLTSSANPALPGASVTFTMGLSAVAPGAGTPTGSVNFLVDGSIAGSGTLSGGVATLSLNTLTHGSHTIAAEYAGDQNFVGSSNTLSSSQAINTPPTANNITIQRYATRNVKVPFATVFTNSTDADGDALNITVASSSAQGETVTVSGGWIFYWPASGFTNADSFTYTVTDGHGGSVTGTVTVAIAVDNNITQNLSITDLGNGSFRIDGHGIPARVYRLQFSDTLSPFNWQDLPGASLTADGVGKFQFTDPSGAPTRFYRSVNP